LRLTREIDLPVTPKGVSQSGRAQPHSKLAAMTSHFQGTRALNIFTRRDWVVEAGFGQVYIALDLTPEDFVVDHSFVCGGAGCFGVRRGVLWDNRS